MFEEGYYRIMRVTTIISQNNVGKSDNSNVEHKKSKQKEYIVCDSIYRKGKNKRHSKSFRIRFMFEGTSAWKGI